MANYTEDMRAHHTTLNVQSGDKFPSLLGVA